MGLNERKDLTLWERRMFSGKDGKPVSIVSMTKKTISHEECERSLDRALRIPFWKRIQRMLFVREKE